MDASGVIAVSFSMAVFAMHPAQLSTPELLAECTLRTLRRGGPGGQHRNKVETAVLIEHSPTGLRAEASERRSQADNRRVAIVRLRLLLAVEHRASCDATADHLPAASGLWCNRRSGTRIDVATEHDDFPAILAELLDALHALAFDVSAAADHFAVTGSQLVNLLRSHPPALAAVNAARGKAGQHRLK
jgi:hypothetical protein